MEQSNSLLLNENALKQCADPKKPVFIYEWLRYLDTILPVTQKADIKSVQKQLVEQLTSRILTGPGPSTRALLARCIAQIYSVGDTYSLFETINFCNDALKGRDDSPSQLPVKLAALACIGAMYESLGRLVGRSYEESYHHMSKWIKNAESQGRAELMVTFSKMVTGLGAAASSIHKDLYKIVRNHITDRVMPVRVAAINCLTAMIPEYSFLYTNEVESISTLCFKSLESSNYEVRLAVARLFAVLFSTAQNPPKATTPGSKQQAGASTSTARVTSVEEAFGILSVGFLRGGIGGFLKSGTAAVAGGQKEIRIGVTLGYIELIKELDSLWLEKNMLLVLKHLVEVVAKCGPLAYTNNQAQASEVVYMRRCIGYILRSTVGAMLSEQAQIAVCKQLGAILADCINSFDYNPDPGVDRVLGPEAYASAEASIAILLEISCLVRQIGTAVTPLFVEASGIMEPVFACLLHPVQATRVTAAWCLRCATVSVPSQLTPLIDRCISRLEHMKACGDAISGYSLALAALLAGSSDCKLGIPHGKSKQVFAVAEDLIKTASQASRLAQVKMQAGWMLVAAVLKLSRSSAQSCLPRLLVLWKSSFPRSIKEAEAEKNRGDAFTWMCTLEARAGALGSMAVFTEYCPSLLSDDVIRKIIQPVECSLVMISHVAVLIRTYGTKLRTLISVVRLRIYSLLSHISPKYYEHLYAQLLRELVADMTLSDNGQSTSCTSHLAALCPGVDESLLGAWLVDTDQAFIEHEMYYSRNGICGSIENDPLCLIQSSMDEEQWWPEPLPPSTAVIDAAITVYGRLYPLVPSKHKMQMTEHFAECIKGTKNINRQQAIQRNVFACLLTSLKAMGEQKGCRLEGDALQKANINLIVPYMSNPNPLLRCAAAEALGRLAQAVGDAQFVASMAQFSFDKLKSCRDAINRTGFALALGSLHRYVGSLGSGQHLNTSVSILLALAQDGTSALVQTWSILALGLIADTGGGMFRGYVEPSLSLCLKLLLNTPAANVDVLQCVGKLVSALITTVGPELQSVGAIEGTRTSFLIASAMMLDNGDPIVQAEAISCLQQLHLFAPRYVHLDRLVTHLCELLSSPHLVLRKASVCCLRQLVQREAREVREHAQTLVPQGIMNTVGRGSTKAVLPETGLEGALLAMLDVENDKMLRQHIEEALVSLVQATCGDHLNYWLSMCKDVLASCMGADMRSTIQIEEKANADNGLDDEDERECADDDATLQSSTEGRDDKPKLMPRWPTRVFATQIVQKLMTVCETERAHLDLALAKELQMSSSGRADYLVLHLSDLVRMSFMGATSDNTNLRLAGLACLQDVINRFSRVPEPEFPGHVILEQFQAQVGAALRPAFAAETPSDVTAAACQVCSTWIGSGVARDLNDLRRVHQLLVSSLGKLTHGSINTQLYSESAATLEKLAILKAWAEVYIVAIEQEKKREEIAAKAKDEEELYQSSESLLSLVTPELGSLIEHWLAALRDSALLSLPAEFASQLPPNGGAYFAPESADSCKEYYRSSWPPILLAAATWLRQSNFELPTNSQGDMAKLESPSKETHFYVMLGICVEALCSNRSYAEGDQTVQLCLRSLKNLLDCDWARMQLMKNVQLPIELMNVLYRLILTRDNLRTQHLCAEVVQSVLSAAQFSINLHRSKDVENGNADNELMESYSGGEGTSNGLQPNKSLAFASLEVSLCLLVRQMPQINSALMKSKSMAPLHYRKYSRLPAESNTLIKLGISILTQIPSLCSPAGKLIVLPSILYLIVGVLRESSSVDQEQLVPDAPPGHVSLAAAAAMQALRTLASQPPSDSTLPKWMALMRSALISLVNLADGDTKTDRGVVMLATAVLATSAPRRVLLGNMEIFGKACRLFRECLESDSKQVVLKCVQSLSSIFGRREVCYPFIKELAPHVLARIRPFVPGDSSRKAALDTVTEEDIPIIQEAIRSLEVILSVAKPNKELTFVNVLVQLLGEFLCDDPQSQYRHLKPTVRRLHDYAILRLNLIGPVYADAFRKVLHSFPQLKQRIEAAIRYQASRSASAQQAQRAAAIAAAKSERMNVAPPTQPAIQLKMDFSAFGAPPLAER
uniref:HEAT repeat-containing protein 5B n=1 Tax=Ascaris suum TaxID=6253 RepID=F1KQ33_ASCSU